LEVLDPNFLFSLLELALVVVVGEPEDRGLLVVVLKGLEDLWLAGFFG